MKRALEIIDPLDEVVVHHTLRDTDISNLAQGKLAAIVVPDYYPETLCEEIAEHFVRHPQHGTYHSNGHAPDVANVGRIGVSFFEVCNDMDLMMDYYNQAVSMTDQLRAVFYPYYSPIDKLRLHLQEIWPAGANLETLRGKKMFVGLCRTVSPQKEFLPHQDIFERDAPEMMEARSLLGQIACNIYLHLDEEGGELELWRQDYSEEDYITLRLPNSYGMDRSKMPLPSCVIKPGLGDLVLFNSRRPHAVLPSKKTYRMSVSCFIGYRGEHMPLTYWS